MSSLRALETAPVTLLGTLCMSELWACWAGRDPEDLLEASPHLLEEHTESQGWEISWTVSGANIF